MISVLELFSLLSCHLIHILLFVLFLLVSLNVFLLLPPAQVYVYGTRDIFCPVYSLFGFDWGPYLEVFWAYSWFCA